MEENKLDSLVANNIGDLEAAIARTKEEIDPKINAAAWATLKRALKDSDFHFDKGDDPDSSWFAPRSWLINDDSDPWFELSHKDGSALETWLACYAAPRSEKEAVGIQWHYDNLYVRDYKAILEAHASDLIIIERAGFRRDGSDIYLPIEFDRELFARGLASDDLSEALEPISRAAEALVDALPAFQRLRDAMVMKARG